MAESAITNFPSQAVSDLEKMTKEYGLKVARAIEGEWFNDRTSKYTTTKNNYHKLRLYARGEQPIQKYKNELSINGDLSYLNLDWKPVPIVPKFVDIVVNGMAQRSYEVKAFSQDSYGVSKRTEYMESILRDMRTRDFNDKAIQNFGVNLYENNPDTLPDTEEELGLHMQLDYKQAVELAEEQAINVLMEGSKFDLTKRRCLYDLTTIGIGAVKTTFNFSEGAKIEYVDPANLVYSYSDSPYFEDIYYVGEVKEVPVNELAKQFPELSEQEIKEIAQPIWDNLVKCSNIKDYGGFTKDFSSQMLYGANEVELGKQWANNKLLTSLSEKQEFLGTIRRNQFITVLYKQTSQTMPGEFLGRLVLGVEDGLVKVFGATIY